MVSLNESRSLHDSSAQLRAKAIRMQLSLGVSFCNLAKTELALGRIDQARLLIQKVRQIARTAHAHIQEPHHIPKEEVSNLTEQRVRLDELRIGLEQKLAA